MHNARLRGRLPLFIKSSSINTLYVDDFLICYSVENMCTIEHRLQHSLNNLQKWLDTNAFKYFSLKTQIVHFCQKHKLHLDPL